MTLMNSHRDVKPANGATVTAPGSPRRVPRGRELRFSRYRREALWLVPILFLALVFHAVNMFGYPYLENDEATYVTRGWHFLTEGDLDLYVYWYDHAPAGWIQLSIWFALTGGTLVFSSLLESARIAMLVLHLANTALVYGLTLRFTNKNRWAAVLAAGLYAMTPLGIYYHRRVLLDNIMILWVLISMLLLTAKSRRLTTVIGSGTAFGIAVLTKLNAVFFGPGMLLLLVHGIEARRRVHAFTYWLAFGASIVVTYFIYAALRSELWAADVDASGRPANVSLMDALTFQAGREDGGQSPWPWSSENGFGATVRDWLEYDALFIALAALAFVVLFIVGIIQRKRNLYPLALVTLALGQLLFLARGGVILSFYVIPLLAIGAIAIGMLFDYLWQPTRMLHFWTGVQAGCVVFGLIAFALVSDWTHFSKDETSNQNAALNMIRTELDSDSVIVVDNYALPGLVQEGDFHNASYFFKAQYDPEISEVFNDDWRDIDYLLVTHEMLTQVRSGRLPDIKEALDHSVILADYTDGSTSYLDFPVYLSTNGDWARVQAVKTRNQIVLQDAWAHYVSTYIESYGRVVEDNQGGATTSSGQASALEQAVLQRDREVFEGVWLWTQHNLQHRTTDSLISQRWSNDDGVDQVSNTDNDCSADLAIVRSLFAGAELWDDPSLADPAHQMVTDWWASCVFEVDGRNLIKASVDGSVEPILVNSGYFNPVYLEDMKGYLPDLDWDGLIEDGYAELSGVVDTFGTMPNWYHVTSTGERLSVAEIFDDADVFGSDAARAIRWLVIHEAETRHAGAGTLLERLTPSVMEYAESDDIQAKVAKLLLAQAADIGVDPQDYYAEVIYQTYLPGDGTWESADFYADHMWRTTWHMAQERLPAEYLLELE